MISYLLLLTLVAASSATGGSPNSSNDTNPMSNHKELIPWKSHFYIRIVLSSIVLLVTGNIFVGLILNRRRLEWPHLIYLNVIVPLSITHISELYQVTTFLLNYNSWHCALSFFGFNMEFLLVCGLLSVSMVNIAGYMCPSKLTRSAILLLFMVPIFVSICIGVTEATWMCTRNALLRSVGKGIVQLVIFRFIPLIAAGGLNFAALVFIVEKPRWSKSARLFTRQIIFDIIILTLITICMLYKGVITVLMYNGEHWNSSTFLHAFEIGLIVDFIVYAVVVFCLCFARSNFSAIRLNCSRFSCANNAHTVFHNLAEEEIHGEHDAPGGRIGINEQFTDDDGSLLTVTFCDVSHVQNEAMPVA